MMEQTTMAMAKVSHYEHDDAFIFRQNQGISVCPISALHRLPGGRCSAALRSQLVWGAALSSLQPAIRWGGPTVSSFSAMKIAFRG